MSKRAPGKGAKTKPKQASAAKAQSVPKSVAKGAAKAASRAVAPRAQAPAVISKSATGKSKINPKRSEGLKLTRPVQTPATVKTPVAAKIAVPEAMKPRRTMTRAAEKAPDKKLTASATTSTIVLPADYRPSEDEPFMNDKHRIYFRQKLVNWKEDIIRQTKETLAGLHEDSTQHADLADRATSETDRALELRARDRQRKLIAKIDAALARLEDGSYGYCEETGEPIGLKRLDARPIATLSVEAQERHERRERVYRED